MGFLKYVWGCANEIQQILWLASVPHVRSSYSKKWRKFNYAKASMYLPQSVRAAPPADVRSLWF